MTTFAWADDLAIEVDKKKASLPYWPAKLNSSIKTPHGGVLFVNEGDQPQWSMLLAHLAKKLADYGWDVALLNVNTADSISWLLELPEAMSVLRQNKNKRIVLIHYGNKLNSSLDYFGKPQSKMVNGLIMLSAYDNLLKSADKPADETATKSIDKPIDKPVSFRFPLLDITGQFDYDMVKSQASQRANELKQNKYRALRLPGAQHDYEYSHQLLISYLHGWMSKLPESSPQAPPINTSYVEPVYSPAQSLALLGWLGMRGGR